MNAFVLKIIALTAMFVDHVGAAFPTNTPLWFRVVGRLTFPIFVYLLAEGFRYTRSPQKYLLRLFAFAIISEPFYDWALTRTRHTSTFYTLWQVDFLNYTNIFYTLFLGGMAIFAYQQINRYIMQQFFGYTEPEDNNNLRNPHYAQNYVQKSSNMPYNPAHLTAAAIAVLPTFGFMWIAEFLGADYGWYGVLFILLMYLIKNPKWLMLVVFAVMNIAQHRGLWPFFRDSIPIDIWFYMMIPATLLTVPLIALYNKERGPSLKWLFYVVYPAHLAVLAGIAFLL